MLNDREIIEHWHLRDAISLHAVSLTAVAVCALVAALCAVLIPALRYPLALFAAADGMVGACCMWRIRRAWKRLMELEKFIR